MELLIYDPAAGDFCWRISRGNRIPAGLKTGCVNKVGYKVIRVDGRLYSAHRLAVLYMTGAMPAADVDHINNDRSDNRWSNLRRATSSQNCCNTYRMKNNTSGVKGVYRPAGRKNWTARLSFEGTTRHLGCFPTKEAAEAAVLSARAATHGEFMNPG